jgi:hypothetical protein
MKQYQAGHIKEDVWGLACMGNAHILFENLKGKRPMNKRQE